MIIIITAVIAKIYGEKVWKTLSRMPGLYGCPMRIATFGYAFILCLPYARYLLYFQ